MIKKISLLSILVFLHCFSPAQMIDTHPSDIYSGELSFNPFSIGENKIKTITMRITSKPDEKIIEDRGLVKVFEFDSTGLIKKFYYTKIKKAEQTEVTDYYIKRGRKIPYTRTQFTYTYDTVFTYFYYNKLRNLILKRTLDGNFYETWYFDYDSLGKIKRQLRCKETNESENKNEFRVGVQTIISDEKFDYSILSNTQIKKKCLNDEGKPYKEVIINLDNAGRKLEENTIFIVGWMRMNNSYRYDSTGRLQEKILVTNSGSETKEVWLYAYDSTGKLMVQKYSRNNERVYEMNFLYDPATTLLTSEVTRFFKEKSISIMKYEYVFY
jgi:hypothetical protein